MEGESKSDSTTDTTVHGEVASDVQPKVETGNEGQPEPQAQRPATPQSRPTFETIYFWRKLISDDFDVSDAAFILDDTEVSSKLMTHVLKAGYKKDNDYSVPQSQQE